MSRPQDALILTWVGQEVEKTIQYIAQHYENIKTENSVRENRIRMHALWLTQRNIYVRGNTTL